MNWMDANIEIKAPDIIAIAEARIDAGNYGMGWLKVDHIGNITRIDPKKIVINIIQDKDNDQ